MGHLVVLAGERPYRVDVIEPHCGEEFDLVAEVTSHQVDVPKAWNRHRLDAWDHLAPDHGFVRASVFRSRPTPPDPTDHRFSIVAGALDASPDAGELNWVPLVPLMNGSPEPAALTDLAIDESAGDSSDLRVAAGSASR
jgi:hypothetical protein